MDDPLLPHISFASFYQGKGPSCEADSVGLEHAIDAFQIKPSVCAAQMIIEWKTESQEQIEKKKALCREYVERYEAEKAVLKRQAGFLQRRVAAERMTAFVNSLKDPGIQP
jgi:hypothetical protein